ncbi:MAG: hypothetical protein IKP60_13725 [Treponema sp.]|nr:hypothetical protein [Treponema sp.]
MNDYRFRLLVEELEEMTASARRAMDVGDVGSMQFWIDRMEDKTNELERFMKTHFIGQ